MEPRGLRIRQTEIKHARVECLIRNAARQAFKTSDGTFGITGT